MSDHFPATGMPVQGTGRCFCGAVTYEWRAVPLWSCHCHCESCRRNCSAPVTSFFGIRDGAWSWTGQPPKLFESKPGVRRWFCDTCGTPMAYAADKFPNETHFYGASMGDPNAFRATFHVHIDEKLDWLEIADDLPRREGHST